MQYYTYLMNVFVVYLLISQNGDLKIRKNKSKFNTYLDLSTYCKF